MGQRTPTRSVAEVMAAFLRRRTWTQADLARAVGLRAEALRNVLRELRDSGIPLESEKEHPHVYWRMAREWYPGGVLFKAEHVPELLRALTHLARSKARDRLLDVVLDQLPARGKLVAKAPVVSRTASEGEEQYLPLIEDAAARKVAIAMKYITASRGGKIGERHVSVHVVVVGPPPRFIATCHRSGELRWFRIDGIVRARLDELEKFRDCDSGAVSEFRAASLDGYKGSGAPVLCSFFVREPDASWVQNNLIEGMRVETLHGGIRVSIETSGLPRLARFVVSLGDAAQPETATLAEAVAELARGALNQAEAALRDGEKGQGSQPVARAPAQPRSDV